MKYAKLVFEQKFQNTVDTGWSDWNTTTDYWLIDTLANKLGFAFKFAIWVPIYQNWSVLNQLFWNVEK